MTAEWRRDEFVVSDERARVDVALVQRFLSEESYWASGIPLEVVRRSLEHSLPLGVYQGQRQVGFARLITDRATFAYLCDVFILEPFRGRGLGSWLVECALAHPELQGLRWWLLATRDAHELYRKLGFTEPSNPEIFMVLRLIQAYNRD